MTGFSKPSVYRSGRAWPRSPSCCGLGGLCFGCGGISCVYFFRLTRPTGSLTRKNSTRTLAQKSGGKTRNSAAATLNLVRVGHALLIKRKINPKTDITGSISYQRVGHCTVLHVRGTFAPFTTSLSLNTCI